MIKRLERLFTKYLLSIFYSIFRILPVKNKTTFATYRHKELKDNFKFIYNELESRNLDFKYVFLFEKYKPSIIGKIEYMIHMIIATYHLATSKFFFIDDFYFPVYVVKLRKETEVIQVWHACGAFKKFGYSILDKSYGANDKYINDIPIHTNYSHVIVSAKEVANYYAEAFNMEVDNIHGYGVPRTDLFFNEDMKKEAINKVYSRYPYLKDKKVVLFAPTFRGTGQTNAKFDVDIDLNKLVNNLDDDYVLALKMHPFVSNNIEFNNDKIVNLSGYDEINDLLLIADMLITDYSSVVFEYSLLERPIIMYAPDKNEYIKERDFYYTYDEFVPGPIAQNTDELINIINKKLWDINAVVNFKNKFFDYQDGKSSSRLVDNIMLKNNIGE